MREETEAKDIKWANEEIKKEWNLLNDKRYEREVDDLTTGVLLGLKKALNILNQLDEPEVLSEEWIDEHAIAVTYDEKSFPIIHQAREKDIVLVKDSEGVLVPKQEEMKVSKMWRDVISQNKEEGHSLRWTLNDIDNLNVNDVDDFAKAWLAYPNIEVEKEQKYYAKVKGFKDEVWNSYIAIHSEGIPEFTGVDNAEVFSIEEWEELGINDDNADFVKVEELEEDV